METKICIKCLCVQPESSFYKFKNRKGILCRYNVCKKCKLIRDKKALLKNEDRLARMKEYGKYYKKKNKDIINTKRRVHFEKNKDRINAKRRLWIENNKDKVKASRDKYRNNNKDKILAYNRANKERINRYPSSVCGNRGLRVSETPSVFIEIYTIIYDINKLSKQIK